MTDEHQPSRPAWQTDELEDEWIDDEPASGPAPDKSDLSYTNLVGSILMRKDDEGELGESSSTSGSGGTFLIRDDVPNLPFLPKTPGKSKKSMVKGFFSPLPLETMFEPPSPPSNPAPLPPPPPPPNAPVIPSRLSQTYIPEYDTSGTRSDGNTEEVEKRSDGDLDDEQREDERRTPSLQLPPEAENFNFTFAPPGPGHLDPTGRSTNAQSTPVPPGRMAQNTPLRLFHFQYDTFTRDHLSAMVDSIAVNTPSGGTTPSTADGSPHGISRASERSLSRLRSTKRIKLSPASDYSPTGDGAAFIMRPVSKTRDYVGESRNLMDNIRKNRDFSTVSTTASVLSPQVNKPSNSPGEPAGNRSMMRSSTRKFQLQSISYII